MKLFAGNALNIAGHKIPLEALAVVATVGAAFLLLRSGRNSNAAALEQQQASGGGVFGGASGTDISGTLANLQSAIASLGNGVAAAAAPALAAMSPTQPSGPSAAGTIPKALGSYPTTSGGKISRSGPVVAPPIPPASRKKTFVDSPLFRQPIYPSGPGIDATSYPSTATLSLPRSRNIVNPRTGTIAGEMPLPPQLVTVDLNVPANKGFNPILARSAGSLALA